MGTQVNPAPLSRVRGAIAHAVAGASPRSQTLGGVVLRPAQLEAAQRAQGAIARHGGVLIADDVGSGKTFVALAIAAEYQRPLVIAPVVLRTMWNEASSRTRVPVRFTSVESLGRGAPAPGGADIVIIDEAHHLRNPATRRYAAARAATAGARVVLLTATAVHNVAGDLDALLALFLGAAARDLDSEACARVIVRTSEPQAGPPVVVHEPLAIRDVSRVIRAIRELPAALAPREGGEAPTLVRMAMLRAWCSSTGACGSMLRRATLQGAAIRDALRAGRYPTRAELSAWSMTGDGQLAFAELIAACPAPVPEHAAHLDAYLAALGAAREGVRASAALDDERTAHLRTIVSAHSGVPVLACTQYAATVDALWSRLRGEAGVAALTSRGARIASGPIARDQALERFAPIAMGVMPPHERERIHLLLATDLVSEGLNLQDAGVVVHLDLPWTAARLAQRVGRVARVGSRHEQVHAYTLAPPRAAAAVLALERRLLRKRALAARLIGGGDRVAALLGEIATRGSSPAEGRARIVGLLAPHARAGTEGESRPMVCGVCAPRAGWLALVASSDGPRLAARVGTSAPTTDPAAIVTAVEWLVTRDESWLPASWPRALSEVQRWLARDRARRLSSAGRAHAARVHGRELAASVAAVTMSPPHLRAKEAERASGALASHWNPHAASPPGSLLALVVFCVNGQTPHRLPL
jgi:superfamily II DNA or RNA helicase